MEHTQQIEKMIRGCVKRFVNVPKEVKEDMYKDLWLFLLEENSQDTEWPDNNYLFEALKNRAIRFLEKEGRHTKTAIKFFNESPFSVWIFTIGAYPGIAVML